MVSWNNPIRWSPARQKQELRRIWREANWRDRLFYVNLTIFIIIPVTMLGVTLHFIDVILIKLHLRKPMQLPPYFPGQ